MAQTEPPSAPPAPSTGLKIAHGANIAFPAMLFGLSFFSIYATSRGAGDLGAREWTTYYQGVSAQPVPTIPILHLGSLISGSVVLLKTGDVKRPSFIAAGVGVVASLAAVVVTFAITAPNVSEVDGWDPNNPPGRLGRLPAADPHGRPAAHDPERHGAGGEHLVARARVVNHGFARALESRCVCSATERCEDEQQRGSSHRLGYLSRRFVGGGMESISEDIG